MKSASVFPASVSLNWQSTFIGLLKRINQGINAPPDAGAARGGSSSGSVRHNKSFCSGVLNE